MCTERVAPADAYKIFVGVIYTARNGYRRAKCGGLHPHLKKLFQRVIEFLNVELPGQFDIDDCSLWPKVNYLARKVMRLGPQNQALTDVQIKELLCGVRKSRANRLYRMKKARSAAHTAKRLQQIRDLAKETPSPSF